MRSSTTITSKEYAILKTKCLNLIGDLRKAQGQLEHIEDFKHGIALNCDRTEDESELAYLGRIASECTELEHDALRREALAEVDAKLHGMQPVATRQPVSWLGRKLSAVAQVVG